MNPLRSVYKKLIFLAGDIRRERCIGGFAWGYYRTKLGSRQVILPDSFLSTHFEVVWASRDTTPENAVTLGLHEEGCSILREYWDKRR